MAYSFVFTHIHNGKANYFSRPLTNPKLGVEAVGVVLAHNAYLMRTGKVPDNAFDYSGTGVVESLGDGEGKEWRDEDGRNALTIIINRRLPTYTFEVATFGSKTTGAPLFMAFAPNTQAAYALHRIVLAYQSFLIGQGTLADGVDFRLLCIQEEI